MLSSVKISVITAAFNASATIERNIASMKSQSYRKFEHIIIDGASNDGTQAIIQKYQGSYCLNWISEPDRGIADALNKGLAIANGNYILVLQADDRLYCKDSLMKAASFLGKGAFDVYASPVIIQHGSGRSVLAKPLNALWRHRFKTPFRHQGTIVRSTIFDRIGFFSESFSIAMDYDFFYRMLKLKPRIIYNDIPLSVMGAEGVGSREDMIRKRIDEEYKVQRKNESSKSWRIAQDLFRMAYLPYKVGAIDLSPIRTMLNIGNPNYKI
jgi:glycosyltransferase involved in cell wall biosynthesis